MLPVNVSPTAQNPTRQTVTHYENFPVASWLCPPALRPPVAAIYHFARTADDLADEGDATSAQRLDELNAYRTELARVAAGQRPSERWESVFSPLAEAITRHKLPFDLLDALLSAFVQDVEKTRDHSGYADRTELLHYCQRSAAPIGRLLLHLYGVTDVKALQQSDAICNALQLINFWQDFSQDLPRGRYYLPYEACARHGVTQAALLSREQTPAATALIAEHVTWARELMMEGAPLVHTVPGRAGWELRLVVQGGLRILDKIERLEFATLQTRPKIRKTDGPLMLWRALRM
ncbi:squalene synthase HpnC [Variovorax sp. HJSM1_2]|uniref:squalene synthase HpnC n=1 Tax=Variovorax sp. HJSM1_2 TaxID=3366263 RepID=UPI003BD5145F